MVPVSELGGGCWATPAGGISPAIRRGPGWGCEGTLGTFGRAASADPAAGLLGCVNAESLRLLRCWHPVPSCKEVVT